MPFGAARAAILVDDAGEASNIGTPVFGGGESSSTDTSMTFTVPASGIPIGAVVNTMLRMGEPGSAHACADDGSNSYVVELTDASHLNANLETVLFRTVVETALVENDTIVISWSGATAARSGVFWWTEGLDTADPKDQATTGLVAEGTNTTATDSGDYETVNDDVILFGIISGAVDGPGAGPISSEDANFTLLGDRGSHLDAGAGPFERGPHVAYRIISASETMSYEPTWDAATDWHCYIVAYKAA